MLFLEPAFQDSLRNHRFYKCSDTLQNLCLHPVRYLKKQTEAWVNLLNVPDGAGFLSVAYWWDFIKAEAVLCSLPQIELNT